MAPRFRTAARGYCGQARRTCRPHQTNSQISSTDALPGRSSAYTDSSRAPAPPAEARPLPLEAIPSACYPFLSTVTFSKGERMRPALLLLLAILLHVQPVSAARSFVDIWDDAVPLLHEGVDIIASGEDPSERSWAEALTFRDPKFQRAGIWDHGTSGPRPSCVRRGPLPRR